MDTVTTEIRPIETRVETKSAAHLFSEVHAQLLAALPKDDPAQEHISMSIETATSLVEKLGIDPLYLDTANVHNTERAMLTLAIAEAWNKESNDFSPQRRRLSVQLSTLYPPYMRSKKMLDTEKSYGTQRIVVEKLIKHFWPESNGTIRWILNNKKLLVERGHLIRDDKCVVFPVHPNEGQKILAEIVKEMGDDYKDQVCFDGLADRENQLIFVWEGSSETSKTHEMQHIDNQGVRIGAFGSGLDEGLTQLRTLKELNQQIPGAFARSSHVGAQYANELRMLYDIFSQNPELDRLFNDNYEKRTNDTSYKLFSKLISLFDLSGLMTLYKVKPLDYQPATNKHEKHWGLVDTSKIPEPPQPLTPEEYKKAWGHEHLYDYQLKSSYAMVHKPVFRPNLSPVFLKAEEAVDELKLEKHFQYTGEIVYPE